MNKWWRNRNSGKTWGLVGGSSCCVVPHRVFWLPRAIWIFVGSLCLLWVYIRMKNFGGENRICSGYLKLLPETICLAYELQRHNTLLSLYCVKACYYKWACQHICKLAPTGLHPSSPTHLIFHTNTITLLTCSHFLSCMSSHLNDKLIWKKSPSSHQNLHTHTHLQTYTHANTKHTLVYYCDVYPCVCISV